MSKTATVYCLTIDGTTAVHFSLDDLVLGIKAEIDELDEESITNCEFTVSFKQMTDKEIEEMPEFDGF